MKLAQVPIETVCDPPESSFNCVATVGGFEGLFENAIAALLGLAGIALFIMLLVGGFKFITSGGDPKSLESAKNTAKAEGQGGFFSFLDYFKKTKGSTGLIPPAARLKELNDKRISGQALTPAEQTEYNNLARQLGIY